MSTHDPSGGQDPAISSELQQAIEELKQTQIYYDIFSQSPAAIGLATSEEWQFVDVNNGFKRLYGYERGEAIGRTLSELDIIVDRELENLLRQLENEPVIDWTETKVRAKDGQIKDALGTFMRLEIQDTIYVVIKLIDITEQRTLEREVLKASERERRRIGQDLHDDLGQWLDGIAMLAQSLKQDLETDSPEAGRAGQIREYILEAIERARRLAKGLAPAALSEQGLVSAIEDYAVHIEKTYELDCQSTYEGLGDVDETTAEQLYRIIQEAVHNAAHHSQANTVVVHLSQDDHTVTAEVVDDGIGIPEEAIEKNEGLGLRTMDYRARMIGGWLDIRRREEGGTVVTCRVENAGG